jgi:hypothetical protein
MPQGRQRRTNLRGALRSLRASLERFRKACQVLTGPTGMMGRPSEDRGVVSFLPVPEPATAALMWPRSLRWFAKLQPWVAFWRE